MSLPPETGPIQVGARSINVARFGEGQPEIVMLHDGLGSIAQWREIPSLIADVTGAAVLAYDRSGHGGSLTTGPADPDWLHTEAAFLAELLEGLNISRPLVVGHSDGGSIALLHAASGGHCSGVVTFAAHVFVEDVCVEKIAAMRANPELIVKGLAKSHSSPGELFDSWSGVWTHDDFRSWDIRALLANIKCPVVLVQGGEDEFATDAQLTETVDAIGGNATLIRIPGVGHALHHRAPQSVVSIVAKLHEQLGS